MGCRVSRQKVKEAQKDKNKIKIDESEKSNEQSVENQIDIVESTRNVSN